ncbi:hypothetical protein PQX77_011890 [Marasmius sp. AFHP31]|nr:hypothetical protein PQX77_011890 [Marasmius sp. AFHP31]
MSKFLRDARDFLITGGNFSHVERDQHNYHGPTTIVQRQIKQRTEFDEFYRVKRGAIYKLRDVYTDKYPRRWDEGDRTPLELDEGRPRADRTISTARVRNEEDTLFTVMQYSGPEARKAFEDDFRKFSRTSTSDVWQIYGYNDSDIPSLISYNKLVPIAHLEGKIGLLGGVYLCSLPLQLHCSRAEMWMDVDRGVFCRGPPGPGLGIYARSLGTMVLPLTAELVQEDVLSRFLASLKSKLVDDVVVGGVSLVISRLTNTPIAITNNIWSGEDGLSDRDFLENGLTRFTLTGRYSFCLELNPRERLAWLSQAWSIFHARGTSLEAPEDLNDYKLTYPSARMGSYLSSSDPRRERLESQQPIYLFVYPPPLNLDNSDPFSNHFWSFDKDSPSPLPHNVCDEFGLPIELRFDVSATSWSNDGYKLIHQYQLLGGFDPATTDFARHIGCGDNIFLSTVSDTDRFEVVDQDTPPKVTGSPLTSGVQEIVSDLATTAHPAFPRSLTTFGTQEFKVGTSSGLPPPSSDSDIIMETFDMDID